MNIQTDDRVESTKNSIVNKLVGILLIAIGAIPIVLAAIYRVNFNIGGAILPIFVGGCTFFSKE